MTTGFTYSNHFLKKPPLNIQYASDKVDMNNFPYRNWFIKSFIEEEITSFICHRNHMFLM